MGVNEKLLARSSPAGFAWHASGGLWRPADHLLLLSEKIVACASGRCPRLMVFMPPRHGKSELISRYTPAWFLGRFPDRKVMLTSYADTFAASWGRRARDTFEETAPNLFGVRLDRESAGGNQWQVRGREGIMVTAGVGGGLTGKGAHLLIIDDPIKNSEEAASQTLRDKQHDWWKSTARTRLQKGSAVILVMTRWHEDDLAGRLLKDQMEEGGDEWEVLCLPAFAEARTSASYPSSKSLDLGPDALERDEGDPLWPEMFDSESLEQTRRAQGSYWFGAMYQQRPAPAEGMLFQRKHFRYFERHDSGLLTIHRDEGPQVFDPAYGRMFMTVDCASSEKTSADFTVVSTWLATVDRDLLLLDRERFQFQGPDVKLLIRRKYFELRPSMVFIENAQAGQAIIQELVREGLPIMKLQPDVDKVTRALPAVARYEEHRIFHPMGAGWVAEEWEPELLSFPNAAHDDQVDTVAYAALQLPFIGGSRVSGDTMLRGRLPVSDSDPRDPADPDEAERDGRVGTITGGILSDPF